MTHFTPVSGFVGGLLIGLATALLMLLQGRIAGISGIFGDLLMPSTGNKGWRLAFILGLISAPLLAMLAGRPLPRPEMPTSYLVIGIAGLLVGIGTRMGSGCTSGHGVCGISRLSIRSMVATCVFMIAAFVTVAIVRRRFGA